MVNFDECYAVFNESLPSLTSSQSPALATWVAVPGTNDSAWALTLQGCQQLCGVSRPHYYEWERISSTITTWVLPVVGVLLQTPFESNQALKTCRLIVRMLGSPIVSLSYILWNIRVLGVCSVLVDMATDMEAPRIPAKQRDQVPRARSGSLASIEDRDFFQMRDSLYILGAMNQYAMTRFVGNDGTSGGSAAHGLLRIVLFSKALVLKPHCHFDACNCTDEIRELREARSRLAETMRRKRKHGVVPVFFSTLWFLFALGLSIQSAFGQLGENATAHYLALGLLLGWLPILVLAGIVDRNPTDPEGTADDLNKLVHSVSRSMLDETTYQHYKAALRGMAARSNVPFDENDTERGMQEIRSLCQLLTPQVSLPRTYEKFFTDFAGQGRIRWHYGCAHPILSEIEDQFIAEAGRGWLLDGGTDEKARVQLVIGNMSKRFGLIFFDYRQMWQITSSFLIVACTIFGAFILSFFTPTIGLGCRSGGYMIYIIIATSLLLVEFAIWFVDWERHERKGSPIHTQDIEYHNLNSMPAHGGWDASHIDAGYDAPLSTDASSEAALHPGFGTNPYDSARADSLQPHATSRHDRPPLITVTMPSASLVAQSSNLLSAATSAANSFTTSSSTSPLTPHSPAVYRPHTPTRWPAVLDWLLSFAELVNTAWLTYIIVAQTFGSYQTCECKTSSWGPWSSLPGTYGGFLDFRIETSAPPAVVWRSWTWGTALGLFPAAAAYAYIVSEWLLQSHMNTLNEHDAMTGLYRARRWRRATYVVRVALQAGVMWCGAVAGLVAGRKGAREKERMTLRWAPWTVRRAGPT